MGPAKRVLLGSAAGVFAVAGAQAADLPVKAKPVEYVRVCSLYGAGFWYVPGTDTCIKIGAYVKLQLQENLAGTGPFMLGAASGLGTIDNGGRNNRWDTSQFTIAGRQAGVSFDMRTQTEYGTLRSYFDALVNVGGSDAQNGGNNGGIAGTTAGNPASPNQLNSVTLVNTRAFIQFAGFTAGRMRSFFDMYFQGTYAFAGQRFGNDTSPNGIIGIAYTWQFGGGLSASLSLEDNNQVAGARGRMVVNQGTDPIAIAGNDTFDNKGVQFLDPVANLRLDQAWGFVGASVALHDASAGYYGSPINPVTAPLEGNGHPGDKFGWAATAAFLVNNPLGLQGDAVAGQAVYSKGAAGYAVPGSPVAFFGSGMNLGFGMLADALFTGTNAANGSAEELTTVWSLNAAYEHRWNPQWRTSLYGGLVGVQYDGAAANMICAALGVPGSTLAPGATRSATQTIAGTGCSPNWSMSEVGTRTLWNPVPDLDVGFDVVWYHLNTAFGGGIATLAQTGAKPAGNYTISNQDSLAGVFRIQRNFLY
jgi:Porin subfamily